METERKNEENNFSVEFHLNWSRGGGGCWYIAEKHGDSANISNWLCARHLLILFSSEWEMTQPIQSSANRESSTPQTAHLPPLPLPICADLNSEVFAAEKRAGKNRLHVSDFRAVCAALTCGLKLWNLQITQTQTIINVEWVLPGFARQQRIRASWQLTKRF